MVHPEANILVNVTFIGNIAVGGSGGGIYIDNINQKLRFNDIKLISNKAYFSGGGIIGLKNVEF